ncbi:glycosyl hydrolase catalytic core-domain-containing protein [Microdochium trichocladiopsis]|uniref:Glycosyl hydrolase catalytic core-domain-containing protein n=1 Tax=Microdochium trichocladiopsis TaxID=1682393 RepID=A0A9P8XSD6_9PEZI|nr:glycosyl hydrolase catalytic core-domain-containing protein [Microdochium trichocladiopsis]KAH7014350.1 glycosyl hydrolase catalytic core-domain-containing protein [Microdochium trichocladiopsis]
MRNLLSTAGAVVASLAVATPLLGLIQPGSAQQTTTAAFPAPSSSSLPASKRGVSYHNDTAAADYDILLSARGPVGWYYTWSPRPGPPAQVFPWGFRDNVEFVPTIHGTGKLASDIADLDKLNASSTHLFSFNEPDELAANGGSQLSPQEAAAAYISSIVPLRSRFRISHPSVTGSQRGFDWLMAFHDACFKIDAKQGCPADFIVVHWYGGFDGLAGWLGQLRKWYTEAGYVAAAAASGSGGGSSSGSGSGSGRDDTNALPFWLGELGIPGAPMDANLAMMSQTLPYLDNLPWIAKYAWFGTFRPAQANNWTGVGVAFFDDEGGLTELGSTFLGGAQKGFAVGDKGRAPPTPSPTSSPTPAPTDGGGGGGGGGGQNGAGRCFVSGAAMGVGFAGVFISVYAWM